MSKSTPSTAHPLLSNSQVRDAFLANDWGKRPVLFRNLLPDFTSPISPDELAGLACEQGSFSRLIIGSGTGPYELKHGPFQEDQFSQLPVSNWTLLVQEVNRLVPQLAQLLDAFSFIPNWRVDDVMVSYAAPGGGVGPHVDNYDVFLVQGLGKRKWQTAYTPISEEDERLVEPCDVRVLEGGFVPDEEWILNPGDVLYVPPRFPHHGVSMDDRCMTFSVGFRAPTVADLMRGWVDDVVEQRGLDRVFLRDTPSDIIQNANDPGRITASAVNQAYESIMNKLLGSGQLRKRFTTWFSQEVSQPKRFRGYEPDLEPLSDGDADTLMEAILSSRNEDQIVLRQQEGTVFTYVENNEEVTMYIDGEPWPVENVEIARAICSARLLDACYLANLATSHTSVRATLKRLLRADVLYTEDEKWRELSS